jgi:thiol-disulfide isomerase/thioredoxin
VRLPIKTVALAAGLLLAACGRKVAGGPAPAGRQSETAALEPVHFPAPELPKPGADVSGTTWINSPPVTLAELRGKVVLVDFWEYTCINCIRTFATNKRWYERYHRDGFEIIGVHDPEFDIAYKVENVRAAVKRFGLPYPIVVDDWFTIWKAYGNTSWPGRYLIDARGMVRFKRLGEGGDEAFERAIRQLLVEAHPGLKFPATETIPPERDAFSPECGVPTPEMYIGPWYGRGVLANREGYHQGRTIEYRWPGWPGDGRAALSGRWETDLNGMIYRGPKQEPGAAAARLAMRYHAREVYAVINVSHGEPSRLYLEQDGRWLAAADKGVEVEFDAQGRSYIDVGEPRMYYLIANPSFSSHTLTLIPAAPGLTVNSFTFGNNCQTGFPHL